MIRQLAEECEVDKSVVSDVVNRMFESGLQYDDHDEVLKYLKPKVGLSRRFLHGTVLSSPAGVSTSSRFMILPVFF